MQLSAVPIAVPSLLDRAFLPGQLYPVYQPVVQLSDLTVVGHEGLMRLRGGGSPAQLLGLARAKGRLAQLEMLAARVVGQGYHYGHPNIHLTVNVSAQAILQGSGRPDELLASLGAAGQDLGRFVVELTEHDIVDDSARLAESVGYLRAAGMRIALDDFGNGHSNFEMWHQIAPEFVKIDRYLVDGISTNAGKLAIVKAMIMVAATLGAELIAEGIETHEDLVVVRDLGIGYGQGYLLGKPAEQPALLVPEGVFSVLNAKLPVHPQSRRPVDTRRLTAVHFMVEAPPVTLLDTNDHVDTLFRQHPDLHAVAVLDGERPVGLINRGAFTEQYSRPFVREIHGRRPCTSFMNKSPILCETSRTVDSMVEILRGEDQRYLADGFVLTEASCYRGLGTGQSLVRRVTEQRIEAARYANPLTFLPGNIPVTEHIDRLLAGDRAFVAAYLDLNHFKPFNDQYGYFRGDKMILMVAAAVGRHVDPTVDFAGHIGGDDFIILFQSDDWERRCRAIVDEFNAAARSLFDAGDLARGGLHSEDRQGNRAFFPLTTLSIGAAPIPAGRPLQAEEVASLAAAAKRKAKRHSLGFYIATMESPDDCHVIGEKAMQ